MPKTPINYNTDATVIYVIYCLTEGIPFTYYGSTTNFTKRKAEHKSNCKMENKRRLYTEINEHGGWDNWAMKVVLIYPCQTKTELQIKEQEFIFINRDLNCYRSYVSPELKVLEQAEYYTENRDQILEQRVEYRAKNRDRILERQAEYHTKNRDQILEQHAEYYTKNRDQILEQRAEYYTKNRDQILERHAEYRAKNKDILAEKARLKRQNALV